jgi:RHS repeat-associated protein/uncharacterized repeat protein (TIGR01451 family)
MRKFVAALVGSALAVSVVPTAAQAAAASTARAVNPGPPKVPAPMATPRNGSRHLAPPAPPPSPVSTAGASRSDFFTPYVHDFVRPDGKRERIISSAPRYYHGADGAWHPIDLRLVQAGDAYQARGIANPIRLATHHGGVVATFTGPAGTLTLSHPGGADVTGAPDTNSGAVHYPGALPGGAAVAEQLRVSGLEETATLSSGSAAASWVDEFVMPPGITAKQVASGVQFVDASGKVQGEISNGIAQDSRNGPHGAGDETAAPATLASQHGQTADVTVSVDHKWLADPARVFPVTVDPSVSWPIQADTSDDYVNSDACNSNYGTQTYLRLGPPGIDAEVCQDPWYPYTGPGSSFGSDSRTRDFLYFPTDNMQSAPWEGHYVISSATVQLWNYYNGNGNGNLSNFTVYDLYGVSSSWATAPGATSLTWANQPDYDNGGYSYGYESTGDGTDYYLGPWTWDIASLANNWLNNNEANNGIELRARTYTESGPTVNSPEYDDSGGSLRWFYSEDYASANGNNAVAPQMDIVYQTVPDGVGGLSAAGYPGYAVVQWDPAFDNGSTITQYNIQPVDVTTGQTLATQYDYTTSGSPIQFEPSGLTIGHSYYFNVWATNGLGDGQVETSNTVTIAKTVPDPPGAPTAYAEPGYAHLTWPVPAANGSAISSYTITAWDDTTGTPVNAGSQTCTSCVTSSPAYDYPGLTVGDTYEFTVYATNSYGNGSPSPYSNLVRIGSAVSVLKAFGQPTAGSGAVNCSSPTTSQQTYVRGDEVPYCVTFTNSGISNVTVSSVQDLLPPGQLISSGATVLSTPSTICQPNPPADACAAPNNSLVVPNFVLTPGSSATISFSAIAVGQDQGCSVVSNLASGATSEPGGPTVTSQSLPALVCNTGVGLQSWWSYVDTNLGPQATGHVNVSDGNLVVQADDTTSVQAHGHLAYILRRTYNSQALSAFQGTPGSFGAGWSLNVAQGDAVAGAGVTSSGLYVPPGESVANPMAVTLVDGSGARLTFAPHAIAAGPLDITTSPTGILATLVPQVLHLDTANYTHLCVDQTFSPPPGIHLSLWRYVEVNGSCGAPSGNVAVLGFAAERPDRLRYEFSATGALLDMVDGSGVDLHYAYTAQPAAGVALGRLTSIYETRAVDSSGNAYSCTSTTPACRSYQFAYPSGSPDEIDVTDPAGRLTKYIFDAAIPTSGDLSGLHLVEVDNPNTATNGKVLYTYGSSNCAGAAAGQLCSVTDPRGNETTFTYSAASQGPARLATIKDRRANAGDTSGAVTTFTYYSNYVTADTGTSGVSCPNNAACHRQRFSSIDSSGRVGEIDAGDATGAYLHQTLFTWDTPSATCRQPDALVDNDLCQVVRKANNDTETGVDNGITTPDQVTSYVYNAEGRTLVTARQTGTTTLYTTSGFHAQYVESGGTTYTFNDTVAGSGTVTSDGPTSGRADANTLFYLSDQTQSLSPNGNAAGANYANYLTAYQVDDSSTAAPNAAPGGTVCSGAGAGSTNTGLLCQTDSPASPGVADPLAANCNVPAITHAEPFACVRYTYDAFGQKTSMTTAKANAETPSGTTPPAYTYTYYSDPGTGGCSGDSYDCDLSQSVSAGGWLKAVTDPYGNFTAFAYDRAGNQVRSWDRNATAGTFIDWYPGTPDSPENCAFTETDYEPVSTYTTACPPSGYATSNYASPWRYVTAKRDQMGDLTTYVVDPNGNQTAIRTPRGNDAGNSSYDTTQSFDANDNRTLTKPPLSGNGTSYTYDPFGNQVSATDSKGHVKVFRYDSVNRQVEIDWTRGAVGATYQPPACRASTSSDAPIPANDVLCSTTKSYDGADNVYATQDGNHQTTYSAFDGVGRKTGQWVPRNDGTYTNLYTEYAYDADGNQTDVCPPRQFTEGGSGWTAASLPTARPLVAATPCAVPSPLPAAYYGTHKAFDAAGRTTSTTTYREQAGTYPVCSGSGACALTSSSTYDADGNQASTTDANGHVTTYVYDLLDRKSSMTVPRNASDAYTTLWSYDPSGDVTSVIKPGSLNTGTGANGALVVDGTTAANSTDGVAHPASNPYLISGTPNYTNVTVQNGGWISVAAYNGSSGGVIQFYATGTVSVCATCGITAVGKGPHGGAGSTSVSASGSAGTGHGPGGGGGSSAAAGGGGGGGGHDADTPAGTGDSMTGGGSGGAAGASYGASDLSDASGLLAMGSGGGGGGASALGAGGSGGAGGGFIHITASTITVGSDQSGNDGTIAADGTNGTNGAGSGTATGAGGGGAGSGGDVWLTADTVNLGINTYDGGVSAQPGNFGMGASTCAVVCSDSDGGDGAFGFIRIDANTLNGQEPLPDLRRYTGRVTAYSYDPAHRLLDTVTGADDTVAGAAGTPDAKGGINIRTRKLYDADGNVVATFSPRAFATSTTSPDPDYMARTDYDAADRPVASYVPRYDNSVSSESDLGGSGLDPNNTQAIQCRLDNRPASVYQPDGEDALPSYGSQEGVCLTTVSYDPAGNRSSVTLPTSPGSGSTNRHVDFTYTDDNLVASVSSPDPSSSSAGRVTSATYTYDADAKQLTVADAQGHTQTTTYNADETVASVQDPGYGSVTHLTKYGYDAGGNQTQLTDPAGHVTTTAYFSDNKKHSVTDGAGDVTSYAYDAAGNPTEVFSPSANAKDSTNPSGTPTVETFTYDNLVATSTVPVAPDSTASTRRETSYGYDRGGRKTSEDTFLVDASGNPIAGKDAGALSFTYFDDDRMATQTGHGGSGTISYTYDAAGNKASVYDSTSNLTLSTTYYLDDLARTVNDGAGRTSQYAYDGAGNRAARADASSSGTRYPTVYVYNDAEANTSISWTDPGAPTGATTIGYNNLGRPQTESDPNGASTAWSFNPDSTLASQTTTSGSTTLASWSYTYNDDSQVLTQSFSGQAATGGTGSGLVTAQFSYAYDSANRLCGFTDAAGSHNITYDHDANRTNYTAGTACTTASSQAYTYNADDSMATSNRSAAFSYNPAGDLLSDTVRLNCYDSFDRLTQTTDGTVNQHCGDTSTTTYTYDGLDRQRSHTDPAATGPVGLHYDGLSQTVSVEIAPTTNLATDYQLDPTGMPKEVNAAAVVGNPATQFLYTDGQGNITTGINGSAVVGCTVRFDPYGTAENGTTSGATPSPCNTGSSPNSQWYRAVHEDPSTSTYQFGPRTYDPSKDAFLTPDSYRDQQSDADLSIHTDPLTENTYAYVNGDPVNLMDLNGHFSGTFCRANDISQADCAALTRQQIAAAAAARAAEEASIAPQVASLEGSIRATSAAVLRQENCITEVETAFWNGDDFSAIGCGALGRARYDSSSGSLVWITTRHTNTQSTQLVCDAGENCTIIAGATIGSALGASGVVLASVPADIARNVRNPWGRKGGPAHQAKIQELIDEIASSEEDLSPQAEFKVETPGGIKSFRFVDVAALDEEGNPVMFYQVGRQTLAGLPVARERAAIADITGVTSEFSDVPVEFVPYNEVPPTEIPEPEEP